MVEYINYEEKQYPIKVGYYALKHASRELKEKSGKALDMENIFSQDLEVLEPLLYYSLVLGARKEKQELDLVREDMEFVLDECLTEFTALIPKFFPQTEDLGKEKPGQPGSQTRKK
jgi:hypothetical protein